MAVGLLIIGSLMGLVGAIGAAIAGQSFATVIGLYFGTSFLSIVLLICICATRNSMAALQRARQDHGSYIGNTN